WRPDSSSGVAGSSAAAVDATNATSPAALTVPLLNASHFDDELPTWKLVESPTNATSSMSPVEARSASDGRPVGPRRTYISEPASLPHSGPEPTPTSTAASLGARQPARTPLGTKARAAATTR